MAQQQKPKTEAEKKSEEALKHATEPQPLPPSTSAEAQEAKEEAEGKEEKIDENLVKLEETISKYEGKFWKSWMYITGFGHVQGGKATRSQLLAFISGMGPDTNLDDWLSDKDEVATYIKANTKKKNPDS
jgi:hypothetical protein